MEAALQALQPPAGSARRGGKGPPRRTTFPSVHRGGKGRAGRKRGRGRRRACAVADPQGSGPGCDLERRSGKMAAAAAGRVSLKVKLVRQLSTSAARPVSKLVKVRGAGVSPAPWAGGDSDDGSPARGRSHRPPALLSSPLLSPPAPHPGVRAGRALCHRAVLRRQQAEEAGPGGEGAEPSVGKVFSSLRLPELVRGWRGGVGWGGWVSRLLPLLRRREGGSALPSGRWPGVVWCLRCAPGVELPGSGAGEAVSSERNVL